MSSGCDALDMVADGVAGGGKGTLRTRGFKRGVFAHPWATWEQRPHGVGTGSSARSELPRETARPTRLSSSPCSRLSSRLISHLPIACYDFSRFSPPASLLLSSSHVPFTPSVVLIAAIPPPSMLTPSSIVIISAVPSYIHSLPIRTHGLHRAPICAFWRRQLLNVG